MTATIPAVHLTPYDRAARGKAARARLPRSGHAAFEPPKTRPDPVETIERQSADRGWSSCRSGTAGCWNRRSASTGRRRDHGR